MGWFNRRRDAEPLPRNDQFSVVSGDLALPSGQSLHFDAIVPTVFSAAMDPTRMDVSGGVAPEEMTWMALELAGAAHPGCRWQDERTVSYRPASATETEWALANGVNERWGG